jgi:hypothetical protein
LALLERPVTVEKTTIDSAVESVLKAVRLGFATGCSLLSQDNARSILIGEDG